MSDTEDATDEDLLRRSTPFAVFDDFLQPQDAEAMRAGIDAHFSDTDNHRPDTHQIWNYWYVPNSYTYLRTLAPRVIPLPALDAFTAALANFAAKRLGLTRLTMPMLSLYVNGCFQSFHNDSANGRFAFVYSLTRPRRSFTGGETLIWRENDYFGEMFTQPLSTDGLYDMVSPAFNRLVIFDDRMPHAVAPVLGQMDPKEARIVLHGHIGEGPADVEGALQADVARSRVAAGVARIKAELGDLVTRFHGPLCLDITVDAAGRIDSVGVLVNRLNPLGRQETTAAVAVVAVLDRLDLIEFPESDGETRIRFPILFG